MSIASSSGRTGPPGPAAPAGRRPVVVLARLGIVLMLIVVVLSAFVRHRSAGLGCTPWPHCLGLAAQVGDAVPAGVAAARMAHRVVATLALALVASLAFMAWPARHVRREDALLAMGLLAVVLFLAGLGVVSAGSRMPAVAIGNLAGGFAMLALCVRLASPQAAEDGRLQRLARAALLLWSLQILLGALLSAGFHGAACGPLADCAAAARGAGWDLSALDPWREPLPGAAAAPRGALLHLLHRAGAVLAAVAVLALAWRAARHGRHRLGLALAGALAMQLALGIAVVAGGLPLPLVLLHSLVAAGVLSLLVRAA